MSKLKLGFLGFYGISGNPSIQPKSI